MFDRQSMIDLSPPPPCIRFPSLACSLHHETCKGANLTYSRRRWLSHPSVRPGCGFAPTAQGPANQRSERPPVSPWCKLLWRCDWKGGGPAPTEWAIAPKAEEVFCVEVFWAWRVFRPALAETVVDGM
jgi:hypothetical protein